MVLLWSQISRSVSSGNLLEVQILGLIPDVWKQKSRGAPSASPGDPAVPECESPHTAGAVGKPRPIAYNKYSFTGQAHGLHVVCGHFGAVTAGLNSCP